MTNMTIASFIDIEEMHAYIIALAHSANIALTDDMLELDNTDDIRTEHESDTIIDIDFIRTHNDYSIRALAHYAQFDLQTMHNCKCDEFCSYALYCKACN